MRARQSFNKAKDKLGLAVAIARGGDVALTEGQTAAMRNNPAFDWQHAKAANSKLFAQDLRSDEMSPLAMRFFRLRRADWEARDNDISWCRFNWDLPAVSPDAARDSRAVRMVKPSAIGPRL